MESTFKISDKEDDIGAFTHVPGSGKISGFHGVSCL